MIKTNKSIIAVILCLALCFTVTGCPGQNEAAALITIVGQSVASLASIQGIDPATIAKIQADFAAASTAVKNWQAGTPSQDIVAALNILQADINLLPVNATTKIYIELAITTIDSIIAIVSPSAAGTSPSPFITFGSHKTVKTMMTARQYKNAWNAIVDAHPGTAKKI